MIFEQHYYNDSASSLILNLVCHSFWKCISFSYYPWNWYYGKHLQYSLTLDTIKQAFSSQILDTVCCDSSNVALLVYPDNVCLGRH